MSGDQTSPRETLDRMIRGSIHAQLLYVAAKLGVPDLLSDGPKTAEELADAVGAHSRSLYRVLRALSSLGVFIEDEEGRFALTPLSEALRTGVPDSMRNPAIMFGESWFWRPYGELHRNVMTGDGAFRHVFSRELFDYLAADPEAAEVFNDCMTASTAGHAAAVAQAYDFTGIETLVDVAGGHGSLLAQILKAHPHLKGVLFDQPGVVDGATRLLEAEGVSDRCRVVGGDFFESVPDGGDAYLLKWIIHDWEDEKAGVILRNCRRVMPQEGKLLIVEREMSPAGEPSSAKLGDITMTVIPGGQERTSKEYRELLASSEFSLTRIVPTESELSVFEAVPTYPFT